MAKDCHAAKIRERPDRSLPETTPRRRSADQDSSASTSHFWNFIETEKANGNSFAVVENLTGGGQRIREVVLID
jgi:hypothetical protein